MTLPTDVPLTPIQEPILLRQVGVSSVNWGNVLEFTHLFRGFRLAINPAKIMIALVAILLIYSAGRVFDWVWGPQVYRDEIVTYQNYTPEAYRMRRDQYIHSRTSALQMDLAEVTIDKKQLPQERIEDLTKSPAAAYRVLKNYYIEQFYDDVETFRQQRNDAEAHPSHIPWSNDALTPADQEQGNRSGAAAALDKRMEDLKNNEVGRGVFDSFLSYEIHQFDLLADNTLSFVRVAPASMDNADIEGAAVTGGLFSKTPDRLWKSDTVVGCVANMVITGPMWLFTGTGPMQWRPENADTWGGWVWMVTYKASYIASLTLLAVFSLLLVALAGAIITRLSALELAGVERVPLKDVFLFSVRRLWVFVKAPITPFLIILAIGAVLGIAGLMGAIPFVGPILLGMLFVGFICVAFVLMLLLLGVLGGFNLLYPTIAVEGSDAFDAMSRAFAYVYARPWRLIFYTVVSLIYGVITFLFVSFAVYLVLSLSHTFAGWGTNVLGYHYGAYSGVSKLDTMWAAPHFTQLIANTNWYVMSWSEYVGSLFLHFWVYMLVTAIGAYVISYYFSSHTIIYLLLRRSVDGQALTEVFVEEIAPAGVNEVVVVTTTTTT